MRGPAERILRALARPGGTVADGAGEMSYPEIAASVDQVAGILRAPPLAADTCLAFACGNDLPSAVVLLALLAAGRTFFLVPRTASPSGHRTDTAVAFCRHLLAGGRRVADAAGVDALPGASVAVTQNRSFRAELAAGPGRLLVATSGSTGAPRFVQHRHDRLVRAAGQCAARLGLLPADRVALPVPLAHMFGLGAAFLPSVVAGASIDLQAGANVPCFRARERRFDPDVAFLTPSFGEALLRLRRTGRAYRLTVMAGDRLPADLFDRYERLHGCLVNLYGSTELGVIAAGDPADPAQRRRDFVGRPMPGVQVGQAEAGADPAGTLRFRHPCGFERYVGADGRAAPEPDGSFASGHGFHSRDAGELIGGYLAVRGRTDDLVNRDGLLVACAEVAAALRAVPGIADAAVLRGDPSRRGSALIACCVPRAALPPDIGAVRKTCLKLLPSRAIPDTFVFLPELPRLPGGKIDRIALRRHHVPDEAAADA